MKNLLLFAWNFFRNPIRNASLLPSSKSASELMLTGIDFSKVNTLVELGPGTGVFTAEILRKARPGTRIILIELEASYINPLRQQFGEQVIVEQANANQMEQILAKHGIDRVDLIVSGLPYTISNKEQLLDSILKVTGQGTIFRFFTYFPPIMKRVYHRLPVRKIAFTPSNFPPLWVYGIN